MDTFPGNSHQSLQLRLKFRTPQTAFPGGTGAGKFLNQCTHLQAVENSVTMRVQVTQYRIFDPIDTARNRIEPRV